MRSRYFNRHNSPRKVEQFRQRITFVPLIGIDHQPKKLARLVLRHKVVGEFQIRGQRQIQVIRHTGSHRIEQQRVGTYFEWLTPHIKQRLTGQQIKEISRRRRPPTEADHNHTNLPDRGIQIRYFFLNIGHGATGR
ncbi:hypothetical protein D3C87_1619480 [compost metagenome]